MKRSLYLFFGLLAGLVLSLSIAGCDSSPNPTVVPTVEPTAAPVAPLSDVSDALSFRLRDDWSGLSTISPITQLYSVAKSDSGGFSGMGTFSVGDGTPRNVTTTVTIDIPADVAAAFLKKVAAFPIKEGSYTAKIDHTDDYPLLTITVDTPGEGTITIYSQSQGDQHVPWGASVQGKDYVIDSAAPSEAIALLDPYLHREIRQQLIDAAGKK